MNTKLDVKRAVDLRKQDAQENWLINGLLPAQKFVLIGASPKCFKSYLALEMAVSLAAGKQCLGRYNVPTAGPVLYLDGEDSQGNIRARLESIVRHDGIGLDDLNLHVLSEQSLTLDAEANRDGLRAVVAKLRPRLLIVDPLCRFLGSIHEGSASGVADLIAFFRSLQLEYGCTVMVLHHLTKGAKGKGDGSALRGSGFLDSAWDALLMLRRDEDKLFLRARFKNCSDTEELPILLKSHSDGAISMSVEAGNERAAAYPMVKSDGTRVFRCRLVAVQGRTG